jgi:antitoxin (DNA-binding transcriptional repressor) of toxin-antitoxin stability system
MATLEGSNTVGTYEAKTHLSALLQKIEAGEEMTLAKT